MTRHIITISIVLACIAVACSSPSGPCAHGYSGTDPHGCAY